MTFSGRRSIPRYAIVLAGALAAALAVSAHYEVLSYWFTGPDTLVLIETSRIRDTRSAIATLTGPLMHGTNFVSLTGLFYRPVASLSYAFDYAVWGLDPFGYHLTDLALHALAAVLLVVLVVEQLRPIDRPNNARSKGGFALLVGALAGGIFAVHPLTAEVVPVPARRHDVLATVFVLASLWALARGLRITPPSWRRYRYLGLSLVAYALALGSKEVGAILAGLAVCWTALFAYGRTGCVIATTRETIRVGLGYGVVSCCYLGLRITLLGDLGGYVGPFGGVRNTPIPELVNQYLLSLFYPVDVLPGDAGASGLLPRFVVVLVAVGVLFSFAGAFVAGGVRPFVRSRAGRLGFFYPVWLCAPLPLLVRVGEYSPWTGYIAIVPVAALAALVLVVGVRGFPRCLRDLRTDRQRLRSGSGPRTGAKAVALALVSILLLSLVVASPLAHSYSGWDRAGTVTEQALTGAEESTRDLPADALIRVEGLPPTTTLASPTATPRAKSLRFFWAHSVRSWLHLRDPESRVSTFTYGRTTPIPNGSVRVRVRANPQPNGPAVMRFQYTRTGANASERSTRARGADATRPGLGLASTTLARHNG